jgi:hypothetical protein
MGMYGEGRGVRSYADGGCPTCELWLHETFNTGPFHASRHYHTEDEVLVCIRGEIMFGARAMTRGGVLAINAKALYTFQTGEGGGAFINFRARNSEVVRVDREGAHPGLDEQRMVRKAVLAAAHEVATAL